MGKKYFKALLENYAGMPMREQKKHLLEALTAYQGEEERNDDITLLGFTIKGTST